MWSNIQIIKEMNRSYLVLQGEENCTEMDYQMRMVTEVPIPVFVNLQIRQTDCHLEYYYDISGKISLEKWLQHQLMNKKELEALFQALFEAYEAVETYLLDADRIVLSPSCIMVNGDCTKVQFCYGADTEGTFFTGLQELMQYLLTRLNHSDGETVRIGYTLYQYCSQEQCAFSEMLEVFENHRADNLWKGQLCHQRSDVSHTEQNDVGTDFMWDSKLPVVLSKEEAEETLCPTGGEGAQKDHNSFGGHKDQRKHFAGKQWLLLGVLSGVLALIGSVCDLNQKNNSGQGGSMVLRIAIVLFAVECIWGLYRYYREHM